MARQFYLGIDVGTGSARAAVFDERGVRLGVGTHPLQHWEPDSDFHEQSSDDIWSACGQAAREALKQNAIAADSIRGIGFCATCSLVALDAEDRPVTISPSGVDAQNVILWMDHRAITQAARINSTGHTALRTVGGSISAEMQAPKLLWLKENLPCTWSRAARFLDLADFLSYRTTGNDVRSLCTTTCKWNYPARDGRWDDDFFSTIGLEDLAEREYSRIGNRVRTQGERAGQLTAAAASELGLVAGIPVAVSLIDAHAGGIGLLGMRLDDENIDQSLESRMALITGSSTCHMAVAREERFVPGVWGPYYSAMIPRWWLAEGGQSATGVLLDRVIYGHARGGDLRLLHEKAEAISAYEILNRRIAELGRYVEFPALLTRNVHVYPDFHGNRSPHPDPTLRGMISGLSMDIGLDALAVEYLATVQAIAHGTCQIIDRLNEHGYGVRTLLACGGGTKNELLLREHADITGCTIVLPEEPEAVLLGAAMLGAVACEDQQTIESAMAAMSRPGRVIRPTGGPVARYHAAKREVHLRMLAHQREYSRLMSV
jgi:FGGY-family pentulose kinase